MNSIQVALCTDIHLNFLNLDKVTKFAEKVFQAGPDVVLVTGDLSEAPTLVQHLKVMMAVIDRPIYFVLGNHDYWKSSFDVVAQKMRDLMKEDARFKWLPESGVVELTSRTALVGVDGWYDAGYGDWKAAGIFMNDWQYIEDFQTGRVMAGMYTGGMSYSKDELISVCRAKAGRDAILAEKLMKEAFEKRDHVILATHVPPYPEVAKHRGRASDPHALPFYTSRSMANAIESAAKDLPDGKTLTVFCGHTHDQAYYKPFPNVSVHCSGAEYSRPVVSSMVKVL